MVTDGEPADVVTVRARMLREGTLAAGEDVLLHDLVSEVPVSANAVGYARVVAEHGYRRRVLLAATDLASAAAECEFIPVKEVDSLIARLLEQRG